MVEFVVCFVYEDYCCLLRVGFRVCFAWIVSLAKGIVDWSCVGLEGGFGHQCMVFKFSRCLFVCVCVYHLVYLLVLNFYQRTVYSELWL